MDQELETRWRAGDAPFSGSILRLKDLDTVTQIRSALLPIVERLQESFPDASLRGLADWHQHDGYVSPSEPITWHELREILRSEDSLRDGCPGDDYVRRAIYASDGSFLLRFYMDELEPVGDFDLSADATLVDAVLSALPAPARSKIEVLNDAKAYFDKRYVG